MVGLNDGWCRSLYQSSQLLVHKEDGDSRQLLGDHGQLGSEVAKDCYWVSSAGWLTCFFVLLQSSVDDR